MKQSHNSNLDNFLLRCSSSGMSSIPEKLAYLYGVSSDTGIESLNNQMLKLRLNAKKNIEDASKLTYQNRLNSLRMWMKQNKYSWLLINRTDNWLNEDLSPRWQHIAWLTGFTGSNAKLVIGLSTASIFSDTRYELQLKNQIDPKNFNILIEPEQNVVAWLCKQKKSNESLAIATDINLISHKTFIELSNKLLKNKIVLSTQHKDPFYDIWKQRPEIPVSMIFVHENTYSGKKWQEKHKLVLEYLKKNNKDAILISQPDTLAWLLNIRAEDIFNSPLWLCNGLFFNDGTVSLYTDNLKLSIELKNHLSSKIQVEPFDKCKASITSLCNSNKALVFSPAYTAHSLIEKVAKEHKNLIFNDNDFIVKLKSKLNYQEITNCFDVHFRDGQKMIKLLSWINQNPVGSLKESDVQKKIFELRSKDKLYKGESFPSISAVGAHSALPHYQVSKNHDSVLAEGDIFLIDCGGQYLDGTTDITRTIFIGKNEPSVKEILSYTMVLKGMIAVSIAVFPNDTCGKTIDVLARQFLWKHGLDYNHGTGHGIGRYLCVHEAPYSIGKYATQCLVENIVLTNEPGIYFPNEFGIRIENTLMTINFSSCENTINKHKSPPYPSLDFLGDKIIKDSKNNNNSISWLAFKTLTMCPFEKKLIDKNSLTALEISWINDYHKQIRDKFLMTMDSIQDQKWLEGATSVLS